MPRWMSWPTCSPEGGRRACNRRLVYDLQNTRPTSWRPRTAAASTANSRCMPPPAPATSSGAAAGDRRSSGGEAADPGPTPREVDAGAEHRLGAVPVAHGARGRVRRQGGSIELLQLPSSEPRLLPEGPGAVRPRDAGGGARGRADVPLAGPPQWCSASCSGEAGAGGEGKGRRHDGPAGACA